VHRAELARRRHGIAAAGLDEEAVDLHGYAPQEVLTGPFGLGVEAAGRQGRRRSRPPGARAATTEDRISLEMEKEERIGFVACPGTTTIT
jgi:hypothetical protein